MKIKVLFFAQLKEAFGFGERTLDLEAPLTVGEAARELLGTLPDEEIKKMPLLYAVNEHYAGAGEVLRDGDVLALMTPVAGG